MQSSTPELFSDPEAPVKEVEGLLKQMNEVGGVPACVECGKPTTGFKTGEDDERIPLCQDCCFEGKPANRAERRARQFRRRKAVFYPFFSKTRSRMHDNR